MMTDNIRQFIEKGAMAEPKEITEAKQEAHHRGYDKGYRNGVAVGIAVCVGLYMLSVISQKVL